MRRKRLFTLGLLILFTLTTLTACSKHKKAMDFIANGFDKNTIIGKVTDISGTKLTLTLYEMPNRGERSKDRQGGGERPSGAPDWSKQNRGADFKGDEQGPNAAPDGKKPGNGQGPNAAPDENSQGNTPNVSGTPGANRQGGMNGFFKETGDTKTIDVTDESLIKIRSGRDEKQGSLKDITIDSTVIVQYEKDGSTISSIIVQDPMGTNPDQDNQDNSTTQ